MLGLATFVFHLGAQVPTALILMLFPFVTLEKDQAMTLLFVFAPEFDWTNPGNLSSVKKHEISYLLHLPPCNTSPSVSIALCLSLSLSLSLSSPFEVK